MGEQTVDATQTRMSCARRHLRYLDDRRDDQLQLHLASGRDVAKIHQRAHRRRSHCNGLQFFRYVNCFFLFLQQRQHRVLRRLGWVKIFQFLVVGLGPL